MSQAQSPQEIKFDGHIIIGIIRGLASVIDVDALREPAKTAAVQAFDTYVQPVNFPNIPDLFEPAIKSAVRSAIPAAVDKVFDALKAAKDTPVVAVHPSGDGFAFVKQ